MRDGHRLYYGWILVAALGVTTIVSYGTTYYLFGVLVVPLGRDFGWSRASLSGAYALGTVFAGLLGMPSGRLVDRYGARVLMSAGSALAGATLLGLTAIQALWQCYALWAVGLGLAGALTFYPVSFTVVTNWFEGKRGKALSVLTLLGGLASAIFVPSAGALVPRLGWRGALVVMAFTQLAIALPLHLFVVRRHPEDLGLQPDGVNTILHSPTAPLAGLTLSAAVRGCAFWLLTGSYALATMATDMLLVHAVAYLVSRGYGTALAASIVGAVGLASLPGRVLLNLLSDRVGAQPLLGFCLVTQAAGVALLLHATSLGWIVAYIVVYGGAFGAVSPLFAAVMASHVGRRAYGSILALQGVPVALAAGFGPILAGWLYDRLGGYSLPFWLAAGSFALAGALILLTSQPSQAQTTGARGAG